MRKRSTGVNLFCDVGSRCSLADHLLNDRGLFAELNGLMIDAYNLVELPLRLMKPSGYYSDPRTGLADLINKSGLCVLDVGCAAGEAGRYLLSTGKASWVSGIEIEPEHAAIAEGKLNEVICGDVCNVRFPWPENHFDCITFGDVLEHLIDPWGLLRRLRPLLKANGFIIASIPNVKFFPVVYGLLVRNEWRYQECGVLDSTHLRFFTKKTAIELFTQCGYHVDFIAPYLSGRRYRIPSRLSFGLLDTLLAVQWQIRATSLGS